VLCGTPSSSRRTEEAERPDAWLAAPGKGLGERNKPLRGARYLYADVTANNDATLLLRDTKTGAKYEFDLAQTVMGKELEGKPAGARVEIMERDHTWVHGQVVDAATGRPTPVRLAFRSRERRYIPPYGHRTEINEGWFQPEFPFSILGQPIAYA
jgi:hypothetical protein